MQTCTLTKTDDNTVFNTQELTQVSGSLNNIVIKNMKNAHDAPKIQINVLHLDEASKEIKGFLGNKPNDVLKAPQNADLVQATWYKNQDKSLILTFKATQPTELTIEMDDTISQEVNDLLKACKLKLSHS